MSVGKLLESLMRSLAVIHLRSPLRNIMTFFSHLGVDLQRENGGIVEILRPSPTLCPFLVPPERV